MRNSVLGATKQYHRLKSVFRGASCAGVFAGLLALAVTVRAQTNSFQKGVNAYAAGDYAAAGRTFAEAAAQRPASGTLQNLGLAEWRCGHCGLAVLAWERALWVDPANRAAREDLRYARKAAQLDEPELAWYEAASTWLPVNLWAVLAGISLWFAIAMVMFPRVFRWRRTGWHQALAAVGFAVFLTCLPSLVGVQTRARIGFVTEGNVPLRLTPTTEGQPLALLAAGEPARCERTRGNFLLIRTSYGRGWVHRKQFGLICPE